MFANSLIGSFSIGILSFKESMGYNVIGLATLYRSRQHEIYNTWLTMMDPKSGPGPQGYLLVSCYIIGSEDNPPVHGINDRNDFEGDDPDGVILFT